MSLELLLDALPARIQQHLKEEGVETADYICAIKTAFKPTATIPILWIVLTKGRLFLCNTHRTRSGWASYSPNDLNTFKLVRDLSGRIHFNIIHSDVERPDLCLPLPINTSPEDARELIHKCDILFHHKIVESSLG